MDALRTETEATGVEALRALRWARRRRAVEHLDVMEALYRAYVAVIFGSLALFVVAGAIADAPIDSEALARVADHGPAVLGIGVALAALAGLRAGAQGGPLAIEAADVQYVLLAPVSRGRALRPAALRQIRVAVMGGGAIGVAVAAFAVPRLPGSSVEWFVVLAAFGALFPLCYLGPALTASGRRLKPTPATTIGSVLLGWTVLDLVLGSTSSPATLLGTLATLPLQSGAKVAAGIGGAAVATLVVIAGLLWVGGISLDLARKRATLAAQLRFSAAVRDLRSVILLRRQLAAERSRPAPWLRLGALARLGEPVARRALRGYLRWPAARLLRLPLLGILAALAVAATWDGTTPLAILPGPLLLIAALDLVEPLAQETDHPTRRDLLPIPVTRLVSHHLRVPVATLALVLAVGVVVLLVLGASGKELLASALAIPGTAFLVSCAAALGATNDPYRDILVPQVAQAWAAAPFVIAPIVTGMPLLLARESARKGRSPVAPTVIAEVMLVVVAAALFPLLSRRIARVGGEA